MGHGRADGSEVLPRARRPLARKPPAPRAADARPARHPRPARASRRVPTSCRRVSPPRARVPPAHARLAVNAERRRRSARRRRTRSSARDALRAASRGEARGVGARGRVALCAAPKPRPRRFGRADDARSPRFPTRRPHRGRGTRPKRRAIARAARARLVQLTMRRVLGVRGGSPRRRLKRASMLGDVARAVVVRPRRRSRLATPRSAAPAEDSRSNNTETRARRRSSTELCRPGRSANPERAPEVRARNAAPYVSRNALIVFFEGVP